MRRRPTRGGPSWGATLMGSGGSTKLAAPSLGEQEGPRWSGAPWSTCAAPVSRPGGTKGAALSSSTCPAGSRDPRAGCDPLVRALGSARAWVPGAGSPVPSRAGPGLSAGALPTPPPSLALATTASPAAPGVPQTPGADTAPPSVPASQPPPLTCPRAPAPAALIPASGLLLSSPVTIAVTSGPTAPGGTCPHPATPTMPLA